MIFTGLVRNYIKCHYMQRTTTTANDYGFRHVFRTKTIGSVVSTPHNIYVLHNRVGRPHSVCARRASRYKIHNIRHHAAPATAAGGMIMIDMIRCSVLIPPMLQHRITYLYILYFVPRYIRTAFRECVFFPRRRRRNEKRRTTSRPRRVVLDDRIAYIIYTSLRAVYIYLNVYIRNLLSRV